MIRKGLITKLSNIFPNIKIYGEAIEQCFKEPCFFVLQLSLQHTKELNRRYHRAYPFDVHYFPSSAYPNDECHKVADKLYDQLEYIEVEGNLYRGTGMNHEVIDGVLHFFVDYNFHLFRKAPETVKMQTMTQEGYLK